MPSPRGRAGPSTAKTIQLMRPSAFARRSLLSAPCAVCRSNTISFALRTGTHVLQTTPKGHHNYLFGHEVHLSFVLFQRRWLIWISKYSCVRQHFLSSYKEYTATRCTLRTVDLAAWCKSMVDRSRSSKVCYDTFSTCVTLLYNREVIHRYTHLP
jgi:hypothetical protein